MSISDEIEDRYLNPIRQIKKNKDDLEFGKKLIEETAANMEKYGNLLSTEHWNEYISYVAKIFNTSERRVRRILRKAGIGG